MGRAANSEPPEIDALLRRRWAARRFATGAEDLARGLLGHFLVRRLDSGEILAGRIVETEAYVGIRDRASHAFGGRRTPRNESMYGPPGTAYVYFTYGLHHCFNIVCGRRDEPLAVLVRALEPVAGMGPMSLRRAASRRRLSDAPAERDLCRGPARLCQALEIDRRLDGADLRRDERIWIAGDRGGTPVVPDNRVLRVPRIGVDYAGPWASRPLRFLIADHPCVSVIPRPAGDSAPRLVKSR